jgi:hypothetical protein
VATIKATVESEIPTKSQRLGELMMDEATKQNAKTDRYIISPAMRSKFEKMLKYQSTPSKSTMIRTILMNPKARLMGLFLGLKMGSFKIKISQSPNIISKINRKKRPFSLS